MTPDPDPDLPPDPVRDLLLPVRRMTDPAMAIESSDLVTNLERESKPEVLMAVPLTGSRSRINLNDFCIFLIIFIGSGLLDNHEVSFTFVNYFVVVGRFPEFELTKPSNT